MNAHSKISQVTYNQINMAEYSTVFIEYPMWNAEKPMLIRIFIEYCDALKNREVYILR